MNKNRNTNIDFGVALLILLILIYLLIAFIEFNLNPMKWMGLTRIFAVGLFVYSGITAGKKLYK